MKRIHRRPAAIEDLIRQVAYRRNAAGEAPATGSRRIGQLLGIPELQWKRVGKTKLWFWYVEEADHVDVIRLVSTDQLPRQAMLPDDLH